MQCGAWRKFKQHCLFAYIFVVYEAIFMPRTSYESYHSALQFHFNHLIDISKRLATGGRVYVCVYYCQIPRLTFLMFSICMQYRPRRLMHARRLKPKLFHARRLFGLDQRACMNFGLESLIAIDLYIAHLVTDHRPQNHRSQNITEKRTFYEMQQL